MEKAVAPHGGSSDDDRASQVEMRLEQLTLALQQVRHTNETLHDLEARFAAMTAECAGILEKWAKNDERHAAALLELHGRLNEWTDIERRLLHESATRIHQFELSVEHQWRALRDKHEAPLQHLDQQATRVLETSLTAVDQGLRGLERAQERLGALETELRQDMAALRGELREALSEWREAAGALGRREPWSLDNVVRLHNELRSETAQGVTAIGSMGGRLAAAPAWAQLTAPDTEPADAAVAPVPSVAERSAWRYPAMLALALLFFGGVVYTLYVQGQVQAAVSEARARAEAAQRAAEETRAAAAQEISEARRVAEERAASTAAAAREAQMLAAILAAADLRRLELAGETGGRITAHVLLSRSQGVSFSASRLAPPPAGQGYQLWLLSPDAATSAGVLPPPSNGRTLAVFGIPMRLPRPIVAARVTIEPAGGSAQPTGPVYLRTRDSQDAASTSGTTP